MIFFRGVELFMLWYGIMKFYDFERSFVSFNLFIGNFDLIFFFGKNIN